MKATRIAAFVGVLLGCSILAIGGGGAPPWVKNTLALLFISLAAVYGFTAFVPSAPAWLSSRPVVGVLAIWAGSGILFVPSNIVCAAFLIAVGTRLLMLEKPTPYTAHAEPGTGLARRNGDIVLRESGTVVARDEEGTWTR